MDNKGKVNGLGVTLVGLIAVGLVLGALVLFQVIPVPTGQTTIKQSTTQAGQVAQATKVGSVSSAGVYVRDISNNDQNTKVTVATYCQDDNGAFIINGTTSSATAEITGKTEIGRTLTCWAFNSTYQSEPVVTKITGESPHIVIDAYRVPTEAKLQFYNDQFNTGYLTANVSAPASGTGSIPKMKFTNNNTDTILPLGGFYFDVAETTNITLIKMDGGVTLSGMSHTSAQLVDSLLTTKVSARKTKWEYVWEIDDDSSVEGNQALLMEENDYLETGSISVTADSDGCNDDGEVITPYVFTKGYYRSSIGGVNYGHETDATTSAVITTDISNGDKLACN